MKNFNKILNQMLTKYLMNKLTQLWDEYFSQTFFVICVWLHVIIKKVFFIYYTKYTFEYLLMITSQRKLMRYKIQRNILNKWIILKC